MSDEALTLFVSISYNSSQHRLISLAPGHILLSLSSFPCHSGVWLDTALPDDPPDCLTLIYNSVFEHRGLKKHRGQTSSVVCNFESNASKSFNFAFTCWKKKNIQRCRSRFINVFLKTEQSQYLEICAVCNRSKVYYLRIWLHNKISVCRLEHLVNCTRFQNIKRFWRLLPLYRVW